MCLTSELKMGCMVPCSRKGEKEEEEARFAAEEEKIWEMRLEKEQIRFELSLCCLSLNPHASFSNESALMHTAV